MTTERNILKYETETLISKYSKWRAISIFALLFEFIYLGLWIIPRKVEVGSVESCIVILFNLMIYAVIFYLFEIYKKILIPLIEYTPLDDKNQIDKDYIEKVNEFRKNVNLVVSIEIILISFSTVLFAITVFKSNFFIIVSDQLKYLSLGTIAPMVLFALKAENPLDDLYWKYDTENYKEYMKKILKKK